MGDRNGDMVTNVVYKRNQCPTRALPTVVFEEAWSGRRPCIAHIQVFRYNEYVMVFDETKGKQNVYLLVIAKTPKHIDSCV